MVIFHGGAVKDGFLVEAAFPVAHAVDAGEVYTRTLEAAPALITFHHGAHRSIRESVLKIYDYLDKHAWTTSLFRREIYRVLDPAHPEENVTEVQAILHEWIACWPKSRTGPGCGGPRAGDAGIESITPASSFDDYTAWIKGAIERWMR